MKPIEQATAIIEHTEARRLPSSVKVDLRDKIASALKHACRDQRHACAEAVKENHGIYDREATDRAASVVMNTPLPDLKPLP